ncbi:hypothetical protein [Fluviicola taffensis]|uniref:Uncharacterized protein n=1 Tax=Fluviicola taffensis (strain DSM 16823 / NCIMB 13979 / RW262) TaxID=755732 RepID=F2IK80_FLUTR|nr:hypothetical protein [Fluviicola taffensis]AEA43983.1 hypothetical protein Fluta_1997 [Fluviicola taffensis DSM 16823]
MENLETIIHNLRFWEDLCIQKDSNKIARTLNQGVGFYFCIPHEMSDLIRKEKKIRLMEEVETCYHAYVGISKEGTLKYYMIHSIYDTEYQFDEGVIRSHIIECDISDNYNGADNEISDEEARRLIGNWKNFHQAWIPLQTVSKDGMYRAFTIPDSDIPVNKELKGFFALKENLNKGEKEVLNFTADLVFSDLENRVVLNGEAFSDLARPVPPFKKGTARAHENFYLLNCPVPNEHL